MLNGSVAATGGAIGTITWPIGPDNRYGMIQNSGPGGVLVIIQGLPNWSVGTGQSACFFIPSQSTARFDSVAAYTWQVAVPD